MGASAICLPASSAWASQFCVCDKDTNCSQRSFSASTSFPSSIIWRHSVISSGAYLIQLCFSNIIISPLSFFVQLNFTKIFLFKAILTKYVYKK